MRDRCISIDWLEVYALEDSSRYPCDADYFVKQGYWVNERAYGTRVWRQMFTVCDAFANPLIEVRRDPASSSLLEKGLFPKEAVHLRLPNVMCYSPDPIGFLRDFMAKHTYTLMKIFRIDIALDFEKFDEGDDPARFIERYMQGRYSKINQANISAHGTDQWGGRVWNSLSWGNKKSMVSTKMYCKTLELAQVADKPYIKVKWLHSHLIDDPVAMTKVAADGKLYEPIIWRVEFSIKASASKWFVIESAFGRHKQIPMPHSLSMYDSDTKLLTMFSSLSMHYFHFKHFQPDKRKDRCRDKVLFKFSPNDVFYKIDTLAAESANTKPELRLITLLRNFYAAHPSPEVYKAVESLVPIIERYALLAMANGHEPIKCMQAMQMVISQRMQGLKSGDVANQLREVQELIDSYPSLF